MLADADQSGPAQLEQLMRNPKEASIQLGGGQAEAMFAQAYHTNFQTTALCSRARGALLTGRNPHASSAPLRAAFATHVASPFPWRRDYHG